MKDLRGLVNQDKVQFTQKVIEWLAEGKTLTELALELDYPYPTLQRVCKDLGIKAGASVLSHVSIEEWATKAKKDIAKERLVSYQHTYNYYHYHKKRLEEGIHEWRRQTSSDQVVDRSPPDPKRGSEDLSRGDSGGELPEGGSSIVDGEQTRKDGT